MATPTTVRFAITIPSASNDPGAERERHLLLTLGLSLEALNVEGCSVPLLVSLLPGVETPQTLPGDPVELMPEEPAPLNATGAGPGPENPDPTGG